MTYFQLDRLDALFPRSEASYLPWPRFAALVYRGRYVRSYIDMDSAIMFGDCGGNKSASVQSEHPCCVRSTHVFDAKNFLVAPPLFRIVSHRVSAFGRL